jgi:hypothetical protein
MKNLKIYLILILPIALLGVNCKKSSAKYHTLKGRLMENCTTPYASKLIKLSGDNSFSDKFCVDINGNNDFYTDENGYFEIKYRKNGNWGILYAPYSVMTFIPIGENENLDIGEVNLNGTVNFVIKLQANKTYTSNDTLVFGDWNNVASNTPDIKLAGPFNSQTLDTATNVSYSSYPIMYGKSPEMSIVYYLKSWSDVKRATVKQMFCAGINNYEEAIFLIE